MSLKMRASMRTSLKRFCWVLAAVLLLCIPVAAAGGGGETAAAEGTPLWLCVPFAGLLLCIAIFPLVKPVWWEEHRAWAVIFWSLLFLIPYGVRSGAAQAVETALECIVNDYLTFIVLLFGLFCVAGNITLEGDLAGSPRVNVALLLLGTMMSSWVGTTGASMLMVRPIIKMNSWRRRRRHIMVFFIFLISNIGGCLTPIGDPPLLMGFSRGVPFFWSLRLFPVMLLNVAILLFVFYHLDMWAYRKDIAEGRKPDISKPGTDVEIHGLHNLLFLVMIVAAVILSGTLPKLPLFQNGEGEVLGVHLFGEVTLSIPSIIEIVIILLAALLSFKTTDSSVRKANHFTWGAIQEVAVLFVGIFITMQPALMILKTCGSQLGLDHPMQMFWATGALSSFLDNTPTYLVFLTTACAESFSNGVVTSLGTVPTKMLMAISCGAVFMGANTYIGNAPNFMVKSISDENGIRMPSFFGYLLWSAAFLLPVFLLDSLIFFL
jgi:Na+/H+ antiporter NhaD/arsenite permease-like protein